MEFRKGKFDQALSDLLRAAKAVEHDDPVVFEHIGDTYLKLNRVPEALDAWQKALALDPKNKTLTDKIEGTKKTIGKDLSGKRILRSERDKNRTSKSAPAFAPLQDSRYPTFNAQRSTLNVEGSDATVIGC